MASALNRSRRFPRKRFLGLVVLTIVVGGGTLLARSVAEARKAARASVVT